MLLNNKTILKAVYFAFISLTVSSQAFALGVDELAGKHIGYMVTDDMLLNADKDPNNWLHYGRDYEQTRFSPLRQINKENIGDMVPKWNLSFGVIGAQTSQVTAVNGRLYVTSSHNKLFALDGTTGDIIWKYERALPGDLGPKLCCGSVNRGVSVYKDKVFMATLDTHAMAFDNNTGEVIWEKKLGDYKTGQILTTMPTIIQGLVIIGNSGGDLGANAGTVYALDPETGDEVWRTYTVPMSADEKIAKTWAGESWKLAGGTPWLPPGYDKETGYILMGVGNPVPDFDGAVREGDNLYTASSIAIDPANGEIKGHFQYTPHDVWDYDGTNETILITDKEGRKVWLHADRNGHLYSIDRKTFKCNWVKAMQRVNWVSSFGKNCRPNVNPDKKPTRGKITTDIAPTLGGGKEWHPATYSKRTGYIYVPGIDMSMDIAAKEQEFQPGQWWLGTSVIRLNPGAGYVKAFDGTTGDLVWMRSQNTPATGGMLSTGGGLVFNGDAEGFFRAMDDETGETLWEYNVGSGVHSNPTTYMVGDTQYVAILVGPGGGSLWPLVYGEFFKTNNKGGSLYVFALHKK
ncbi:MAG: PQQ-dependent dehydrogenase, methanol/ethanol family [Gammaproteobacteria bacterium]